MPGSTNMTDNYLWKPSPAVVEYSNVGRFMRRHRIGTYRDLIARSTGEIEWFWQAAVEDLEIEFYRPFDAVLDSSGGIAWTTWFRGGTINLAHHCLDRHARSPRRDQIAVIAEGEDGVVRRLSYGELHAETCRLANALVSLGIGQGDAIGLFLPMIPEAVISFLACAKIGAIAVPIFSGFGAQAVAARLSDCSAKAVITVDASVRRGHRIEMEPVAAEAAAACPSLRHVIVASRRRGEQAEAPLPCQLPGLGRSRRLCFARAAVGGARSGNAGVDRLHFGDDRAAQGGRSRARRVSGQDRAGGGPPGRHARGRPAVLGDRPGLDHGTVGDHRRTGCRRDGRSRRGCTRLSGGRSDLVDRRAAWSHDSGGFADSGSCPHAARRRAGCARTI